MATMPSPMKMPLRTRRSGDAPWRLMTKKAPPVTTIATTSERVVNPMSYDNGIGTTTASMPMKCIDHTPPPITIAAATSHTRRASPRAAPTCPPRSRAVYDAKEATRMDRATRYGSCVPVTTIGTAPIRTRDQRATNRPTHLHMQPATLSGRYQRPMLADVPQMTWFVNIKMLLWRLVDKMHGE